MLDLFQIMAGNPACNGLGPVVAVIKNGVFPIIYIGIPILLILFGTIDLGKAVMANDDKAIKTATSSLIKRAIAALAVFFVTMLVNLVLGWLSKGGIEGGTKYDGCWQDPMNENATTDAGDAQEGV